MSSAEVATPTSHPIRGYCIDESVLKGFKVDSFKGNELQKMEDICMNIGSKCKDNKPLYNRLLSTLIKQVNSMTLQLKPILIL